MFLFVLSCMTVETVFVLFWTMLEPNRKLIRHKIDSILLGDNFPQDCFFFMIIRWIS